jgi:hypothetical protein
MRLGFKYKQAMFNLEIILGKVRRIGKMYIDVM